MAELLGQGDCAQQSALAEELVVEDGLDDETEYSGEEGDAENDDDVDLWGEEGEVEGEEYDQHDELDDVDDEGSAVLGTEGLVADLEGDVDLVVLGDVDLGGLLGVDHGNRKVIGN